MRRLTLSLLIAAIAVCSPAAADWTGVLRELPAKIGRLAMMKGDAQPGTCTAVILNTSKAEVDNVRGAFALTAAHCVARAPNERLDLTLNGRHAETVVFNRLLDLAIVRFDPKDEAAIALADRPALAGQDIAIVGFAFGRPQLVSQFGHVALPLELTYQELWLDGVTIPGDSGGPVINLAGELVAMTTGIRYGAAGSAHVGTAVDASRIREFARTYLPQGQP